MHIYDAIVNIHEESICDILRKKQTNPMKYKKRVLEKKIKKYLKSFSTVGITGARQSGKSTLLQHLLGDSYTYVTFDDYKAYDFFMMMQNFL